METQVIEVRLKPSENRQNLYIRGFDPVTGDPYVWGSEVKQVVVPVSVLAELESDLSLDVRRIDARMQASKRMELAVAADVAASAAENVAKGLRAKAEMLFSEAQAAHDFAQTTPLPSPAAKRETPGTDQLWAALPNETKKLIEENKMSQQQVTEELLKTPLKRAREQVLVSHNVSRGQAMEQAFGKKVK
jgi:hypothetical protein